MCVYVERFTNYKPQPYIGIPMFGGRCDCKAGCVRSKPPIRSNLSILVSDPFSGTVPKVEPRKPYNSTEADRPTTSGLWQAVMKCTSCGIHTLSLTRYPSFAIPHMLPLTRHPLPTIHRPLPPFQQRPAEITGHKSDHTNSSHKGADSCTSSLSFRVSL